MIENDSMHSDPVDVPVPRTAPLSSSAPLSLERRPMSGAAWGWLLALCAWSLLVAFYHLDGGAGLEPVEAWVAQPAREIYENISNMLAQRDEKGWDWRPIVIPQFCGETRLQKSPGAYWTVCLVSYLRGGVVDEVSIRIPNAIAAVVMVLTIFWLTRRIAGERAAIFAGFAAASSTMFLAWSHNGASDMGTATLITLSLACLWVASEDEPPGRKRTLLWLAGYFCAGLAMIYKFPLPAPCIGIPAILYVLLRNRWKIFASWWHVLGLILFLLPWLPWALAAMHFEDMAIHKWRVEYVDRVTGELPNVEDQTDWFWTVFYIGIALLLSIPYTLSIPAALARPFRKTEHVRREGVWFVLIWFVSLLVFFTFATGKETRYFLPAMPPLFVLLGGELAAFFDPRRPNRPGLDRFGLMAVCLLAPAVLVGVGFGLHHFWQENASQGMFTWPQVLEPYLVSAALLAVGFIVSATLYFRRHENVAFGALAGTMWLTWLWVWPQMMPILASQAPFRDFAERLKQLTPEQKSALRQVAQQDPRYIWYSDVRFPRVIDQLALLDELGGKRNLNHEIERYLQACVEALESDKLVLLVASPDHYGLFMTNLRDRWEAEGHTYPETYLWFQSQAGRDNRRYLVFGNRPPPVPPPALVLPKVWQDELKKRADRMPASVPAAELAPSTQTAPKHE